RSRLGAATFAGLEQARRLRLDDCKLDELTPAALAPLVALRELTVRTGNADWGARRLRIPSHAFAKLRHLRKLELSHNGIQKLGSDVLCGAPSLHRLSLAHNALAVCHVGLDGCASKLHHLDLSHNRLGDVPGDCLAGLRQLRSLRLGHNRIRAIGARSFAALSHLRALSVESSGLHHVAAEAFAANGELRSLELQGNALERLPAAALRELRHLTLLNLSRNTLGRGGDGRLAVRGPLRLTVLDVSHNALTAPPQLGDLFSLQALNLSHNRIAAVSGVQFAALVNLGTLDLKANRLRHLPPLTMRGLTHLQLSRNRLESVAAVALAGCPALRSLNLSDNRLPVVPGAVHQLQYLEELDLAGNRLRNVTSRRAGSGAGLASLRRLDLSRNGITNIGASDLLPLWSVHWLDLSDNNISSVAVGTFQKLSAIAMLRLARNQVAEIGELFMAVKTLRRLDLSHNKISRFDLAMIPRQLRVLDLGFNNISKLDNQFDVENIIDLEVLNLTNNAIRNLTAGAVPSRLLELIASHNNISYVASDAFVNRTGLALIDLRSNRLRSLNDFSLKNRTLLLGGNHVLCDCTMEWLLTGSTLIADQHDILCDVLDGRRGARTALSAMTPSMFLCRYETHCFALCLCCEFDACDCEMACPQGCSCLHDLLWNINTVDCSHQNHSRIPQPMPMDATDVFLDGNAIVSLGNHVLIGRKYMRRLYLNNSDIDAVDNKTFNGLSGLHELHLQHNRIHTLVGYEFEDLASLQRLYLHRNRIAWVNASVFEPLLLLRELTLHANRLSEFEQWPFAHNPGLTLLTLAENRWSCRCEPLRRLRRWLLANVKRVADASRVACGEALASGAAAVVASRADVYVSLSLFVVLSASVLVALTVAAFAFRRQIRLFLFTELNVRLGEADDGEGSLFDVFVSYGSKDAQLAGRLVAELETGHPAFRCCVLHRDVPPQPDAIRRAAAASRRVLLIVTQNFLDNEWCHFDFKSAHTDAAVSGRRRLVLVCDGRLPDAETDPEMALLLRAHPVVRCGQKRFWRTLRFRLPRPDVPGLFVETHDSSRVYYTIDFQGGHTGPAASPSGARHATLHTYQNSDELAAAAESPSVDGREAPGYLPASWVFYSVRRGAAPPGEQHAGQTYLV
ncbi:toll-like receptor 7, partial [Pollicipes pollicipes]|uniref:toll-like receptor 7 n=1 Tax=Pollicipes pollicipes TaxID=41117 RepID=UPI0018853E91